MRALILIFLLPQAISAQNWTWNTAVKTESFISLCKTADQSLISYCPEGVTFTKYDYTGNQLWKKQIPGNATISSISASPDSGFYIAGNFTGNLVMNNYSVVSKGYGDFFVARYNKTGTLMWLKGGGSNQSDRVNDIKADGYGFVLTGFANDTITFGNQVFGKAHNMDLFVMRLTENGVVTKTKFVTGVASQGPPPGISIGNEIETDASGNVTVLGLAYRQVQVDTFNFYHCSWSCDEMGGLVIKFDSNLTAKNIYLAGSTSTLRDLRVNVAGDAFFVEHDSWKYTSYSSIHKMDLNGTTSGFFSYYAEVPFGSGGHMALFTVFDMQFDSCSNLYLTGWRERAYYSGQPEPVIYLVTAQVSPAGHLNWRHEDSASYHNFRTGTAIVPLAPNYCYVAGIFQDTLQLMSSLIGDTSQIYTNSGQLNGSFHAIIQTTVGLPVNHTSTGNQSVCEGKQTKLQVSSTGGISWFTSPTSFTAVGYGSTFSTPILSAGTYTYYAEASSCTTTTGRLPVIFTVIPSPLISVPDGIICKKGSHTITPTGATSYTFENGTAIVSPTSNTTYSLTGASALGCTASAICNVSVLPLPQPTIVSSINFMCIGQTATLTGLGASTYTWQGGQASQTITVSPVINTMYTVTASDQYGCTNSAIFPQFVYDCTIGLNSVDVNSKFLFYPNPAQVLIHFELPSKARVTILNTLGQEMYSEELDAGTHSLDLSELAPGTYIIGMGGSYSRLIKQ